MANLIQANNEWVVSYLDYDDKVAQRNFKTIELAADFLEFKIGIKDEEIDYALCQLAAYSHKRAIFGKNGTYNHSQAE